MTGTIYDKIDGTSPNFRHFIYSPDNPNFSGTQPAVPRIGANGGLINGSPSILLSGSTSVGTVAGALSSNTTIQKVTIVTSRENTNSIVVGNSSSQTITLYSGSLEKIDIEIDNLNKIYLRSTSGTQTVLWLAS